MSGQHRVAHFFNGRETPASDVIQVSTIYSIIIELPSLMYVSKGCLSLDETDQRVSKLVCSMDNV